MDGGFLFWRLITDIIATYVGGMQSWLALPAGKALKDAALRGYDGVAAMEPVVARHALALLSAQVLPLLVPHS